MTKQVRIENADTSSYKFLQVPTSSYKFLQVPTSSYKFLQVPTSSYKLVVQVWDMGQNGEPDTMAHETELGYPTAMREDYIHNTRYIVVKEI